LMEALAAVGLAGNIVQFVDFSCKLFDQATSIYHSTSGTSRDAEDLESITRNLQDLSVRLSQKNHNQTHPQDHTALKKLAKECETTANELLSALQALKAKKPDSKWNSFRTALASAWKQPRVDALEKRLHTYRSQLIIQLQSEILHLLDELSGKSQRMGTVVTNQISGLRSEIQYAVKALREDFAQQNSAKTSILVMRESSPAIDISALASKLISSETSGINMVVAVALLDRLTFDQIESRHSQIHKTHPRTFEWVWSNKFEQWVKSPKQLFWISGKPGSGKSTLMKYIVDNPNTHFLLRQWAAPQELVVASYFFWINGSELQRSQEGLLQSVLYELLRQCPDHIESVLPEAWQTMETSKSEGKSSQYAWKKAELLKAFQRLVKLDRNGPRFFIFIDGLDEYKGSHEGLIETISHMSSMGVKICVASRPWNVFEDAFGQDLDCKIYMEELNKPDIELYVNDKLRSRAEFQSMQLSTTDSDEILNEIIDKSHGVFLWVCLVVPSLIEGLRNRDRFSQLQKRLRDFPSDLDEFFGHIFRSLDPTYKIQMAHMFQVALAARDPLSPLAYWFFDEIEDSPDMALSMPVELLQESEFDRRGQEMKIRINGRCKGLLEITSLPNKSLTNHYRVDFLHRTVKDFLMTTETGQRVLNLQQRGFDADLAICKATLAEMK
ncbi:P-loop containing nucleoside triphosphate hydrolase protein, partial [Massariosphaeria phaeospora]